MLQTDPAVSETTRIMRIFLVGFMASGKSYLGRELALLTGLPFLDLDALIEQRSGLSIAAWFEQRGEDAFRKYEREQLRSVVEWPDLILACGGGTPCFYDNMEWMNQQGLTIYLEVPTELLFRRLSKEKASRPLVAVLAEKELETWIQERLSSRLPYYRMANMVIDNSSVEAAATLLHDLHTRGFL